MVVFPLALSSLALIGSVSSLSDVQQIAWRAHTAIEKGDTSAIPWLLTVLQDPPEDYRDTTLEYVLDALIQLEAQVDPELLEVVLDSERAEIHRRAIVLLSRDVIDGEALLIDMIDGVDLNRPSYLAAAELLMDSRSPKIAPRLLQHLHPAVRVIVHDPNMGFGGSYGIGCGGGFGLRGRMSGFPPSVRYDFIEGDPKSEETSSWALRLAARPMEIWVLRRPGMGSSYGLGYEPGTSEALDLLAELSGLPRASIELEDEPKKYIVWKSAIRYQVELEAFIRVRLGRYEQLIAVLDGEGLLERKAPPLDLEVSIEDRRRDKSALPTIKVAHVRSRLLEDEED